MKHRESEEMYLETILLLEKKKGNVRRVDVAAEFGYSKASVTNAIKRLQEKDYIRIDHGAFIRLTEAGREVAQAVYEKHHLITQLLIRIGAEPSVAEDNACRIEHVICQELLETIRTYMNGETLVYE